MKPEMEDNVNITVATVPTKWWMPMMTSRESDATNSLSPLRGGMNTTRTETPVVSQTPYINFSCKNSPFIVATVPTPTQINPLVRIAHTR